MKESLGVKYANILHSVASKSNQEELYLRQLGEVARLFQKENLLRKTFLSPLIADQEKKNILEKLFGDRIEEMLLRFLTLLSKRNRLSLLPEILAQFTIQVKKKGGITPIELISIGAIDADSKRTLEQKLTQARGQQIELVERHDPRLLGGIILLFPNHQMLDMSLKTRLHHLKTYLKGTTHAIPS